MKHRPGRISTLLMALVATLAIGAGAGAVAYSTFSSPDTKTIVRVPVGKPVPRDLGDASTGHPLDASHEFRRQRRAEDRRGQDPDPAGRVQV